MHDTSPVEALARAGVMHGIETGVVQERTRIARLIGQVELSPCECESIWLALGRHSPECIREAEAAYMQRVIDAIFSPTVPAGSVATGGRPVPGQPTEAGSDPAETAALGVSGV